MQTPIVKELPLRMEPVTPDEFIEPAPQQPRTAGDRLGPGRRPTGPARRRGRT